MKIESSSVLKLRITGLSDLDPISVLLEDLAPEKGQLIITCAGKSWTHYWGAMGNRNIAQFFSMAGQDYLACKFAPELPDEVIDLDAVERDVRAHICKLRRKRQLSARKAREDYRAICYFQNLEDLEELEEMLTTIYGEEWRYYLPQCPNPPYVYLCRIIAAAKEGVKAALGSDMLKVAA
ncbi:hypothetical protein [Chitinimonas sp. BJB300]|uniref:hypothetical protein n=1 Tax=Chitinimonas sp. BJB300 TaxID=1559339 RepID=UPI000C108B73|nr:hypothetical protein [Chitinimonas sp. BJB300]PHV12074.1 hypothetical protein CSQ89_07620 [Chitinimonas sp. BJB300]TSJ87322.1 hypothetical protein FG002_013835 [Chitinimonas sp. BJB300]